MKTRTLIGIVSVALLDTLALTPSANAQVEGPAPAQAAAAFEDMKRTLGVVPSFFRLFPPGAVGAAWDEFKGFQLSPNTAIPPKYKELIGLAVAAQVPCRYCTYFHTKAAELHGAKAPELTEAVVIASLTRQWSTVLNGQQTDAAEFRRDFGRILEHVKQPRAKPPAAVPVTDAASAYRDIEQTLGVVLPMFRLFPETAIAGAWREYKAVELNPNTAVPNKYKELIGLAVASQIPCQYCIYFHSEAAKLNGATAAELQEAIAMAALTRHWSTFLNGMMVDEAQFRKETDQAIRYVRRRAGVATR